MNVRMIFALVFVSLAVGCKGKNEADTLTGHISNSGEAVGNVTVVVVAPGGEEVGVLADATGAYKIDNPPVGALKFKLTGFAPPPPPGVDAVYSPSGNSRIPRRYHSTDNELVFDYSGGSQTYDIDLKK